MLSSNFSLLSDYRTAIEHPAWGSFVSAMEGRQYGLEALSTAWCWFRDGWDAFTAERDRYLSDV